MKRYYILGLAAIVGFLAACKKTDDNLDKPINGLGGDTWVKTELDNWLYTTFTAPYNLEVKYRWDGTETDVSKTLVPPDVSKVRPLMEVVNQAWIEPYIAQKNADFIKLYSPKQYLLVGSAQYNSGTVTLGEAEGGYKVTLFNVNNFDKTNRDIAQRVLKTIHHEFTHILHQTIMYPKEFPYITPEGYTADWSSSTNAGYLKSGFITQYAQAAPSEDFAEMTSIMLVYGRSGYETTLLPVDSAAKATIRKKENIVVNYFKQTWGIDFTGLQTKVQSAFSKIAPVSLYPTLGYKKTFDSIYVNPNVQGMSTYFANTWKAADSAMATIDATSLYKPDNMSIYFTGGDTAILKVMYHATAGSKINTATAAIFTLRATANATAKTYTFSVLSKDANATLITAGIKGITDWLTSGAMSVNYYYTPALDIEYGGFAKSTDSQASVFGTLNL